MAAKKRKTRATEGPKGPRAYDPKDARIGPVNSYEDVANSEDEFFLNQDEVLLDPPAAKRRRQAQEDDFIEPSDEEILAYESSEDEEDGEGEEQDDEEEEAFTSQRKRTPGTTADEEEEELDEGWGSSKKDYYDADDIETEADAMMEEAEAKRLQAKRLQNMTEADFGFDWMDEGGDGANEDDGAEVVTEVLKDVQITPEMDPKDRMEILRARYPEFDSLADEFHTVCQYYTKIKTKLVEFDGAQESRSYKAALINAQIAVLYRSALSMYFGILTSPAQLDEGRVLAIDPESLRDHDIMQALLVYRQLWQRVTKDSSLQNLVFNPSSEDLRTRSSLEVDEEDIVLEERPRAAQRKPKPRETGVQQQLPELSKKEQKKMKKALETEQATKKRTARELQKRKQAAEANIADLASLMPSKKSGKSVSFAVSEPPAPKKQPSAGDSEDSDFGEETTLDAKTAAQKAARRKSLRFYTSQITQKANRRADAGRDAGGDTDLPYRERLRDRQARLNSEAEKRGKMLDSYGRGGSSSALHDDSGDDDNDDADTAQKLRADEDEYYDMITSHSRQRKAEKEARAAAAKDEKARAALSRVPEAGDMHDNDEKRAIGYTIEKNRSLKSTKKKNPISRVKKRLRFEAAKKKIGSMRAVYKGPEEKGGYQGEKTGIKTGLVRSVKL